MNTQRFLLIFLFLTTALCGEEELAMQPICVIGEVAPCAFVNDSVNVVDGGLYLCMKHLKVPGHVPLDLVQYYNSRSDYSSWFGAGMSLNYSFWMQGVAHAKIGHDYEGLMAESAGGSIISCIAKELDETGTQNYYLDPKVIHEGFSNCAAGQISARTNLKNCRVKEQRVNYYNDYKWTSYLPDGTVRYYKKATNKEDLVVVKEEKRLNGTSLHFDYSPRTLKQDSIKEIVAKGHATLNRLKFSRNNKKQKASVTSASGKKVRFSSFKKNEKHYVEKIESSDGPTYHFRYIDAGTRHVIQRIELPNDRFLELEYDTKARVVAQKAPVGKEGEKRTIYSFDYANEHTTVIDGNKHKKIYRHKNNRITDIEEYRTSGLYRIHSYYWGKKEGLSWRKQPTGKEGNLLGYATLNSEKCAVASCYYEYDDHGNILQETLAGNLSGNYPWPFWVDEEARPKDQNVERYQKRYSYSSQNLLIEQREEFGPRIEYRYKAGSDLISAALSYDSDQIVRREFYAYDINNILVEKIVDDGRSDKREDLAFVTQRLVTTIVPTAIGLPQDVRETYLDLATNSLQLLKHTHYNYNKAGQVIEEAIFDANESYRYSTWYEYDHKGRLHKKTNPLGQIFTYVYDANNNKTYEKQEDADFHTKFEYDAANRCTQAIQYHYDNTNVKEQFEYDLMGNKTASTDRYGNTTHYLYDGCNRLIQTTLPKNEFRIKKEHDLFDNVSRETNEKGATTTTEYTIRNKPCRRTFADGSQERFQYNKKGTLFKKWDKNGTRTMYHYDKFDRITRTYVHDQEGNKLLETLNTYNSFHLLSSQNARGHTTYYRYDGAGRVVEELLESADNYQKTAFEYDTLGRIFRIKRFYGKERTQCTATEREYDNLDRIVSEREQDSQGNSTGWIRYEYDAQGNCCKKTTPTSEVFNRYNSKNELVETIDEEGNKIEIAYNHSFINKKGQKILQKITCDGLDTSSEEYFDQLGRCISLLRKNAKGKLTHVTDYRYNPTGQKIREVHDGNYAVSWKYDILDRLVRLVEQPHTKEKKETHYSYDNGGRIKTIQKPNGTTLEHSYDALSRLATLRSSDETIAYSYSYDRNNNPRTIVDEVHGITTRRRYDAWNRLVQDDIENIYNVSHRYDALGRPLTVKLPDGSKVKYSYDDTHLQTVQYKALIHHYKAFDMEHRPTSCELINNLGTLALVWDKKGRIASSTSPYYSHTLEAFDPVGNLTHYSYEDPQGKKSITNEYDDLYQLTTESGYTYAHDSLHNRLQKNGDIYTVDQHNKIINDGVHTFSYDKNGNPIDDGISTYRYDALDRLIEVKRGDTVTHYLYDSFNRRIAKNNTYFFYQDMREIGTIHEGKIDELRILGIGKAGELGASVAIKLGDTWYCPIHDFRGNIVCLINEQKEPVQTYRYTAFGECESSASDMHSPWRFASKRYDPETDLVYFHCRYYSPSHGRFFTCDPLGFADGPNLYAYVHNNPLTHFDLYGLLASQDLCDRVFTRDGGNVCFNARVPERDERPFFDSRSKWLDGIGTLRLPNIFMGVTNGVLNSEEDAKKNFTYLSSLGNSVTLDALYNATHGALDLVEATLQTQAGIYSNPSRILADKYAEFAAKYPSGAPYLQTSHSQGAAVVKHALKMSKPAVQQRIISVTIGPAQIIPSSLCLQSYNYVSKRDWVPFLADPIGLLTNRDCVYYLDPHPDANRFFDHSFQSPTYRGPLKDHIQQHIEKYGAIK